MDIDAIKYFLDNQLSAMQKGNSESESILIMADYLLEQIKNSPDSFKNANEKERRLLLKRCAKITRYTKDFADSYGSDIIESAKLSITTINENAAKLSKLEEDCISAETNEKVIAKQIADIMSKNSELLAKEASLKERSNEYNNLLAKVEECRNIIENITDEKIESLRKEISETEDDAKARKTENETLSKQSEEAKETLENLKKENERITSEMAKIKAEISELDSKFSADTKEAEKLAKALKKAQDQLDEVSAVLEQNDRIAEQLRKNGFVLDDSKSENNFYNYVEIMQDRANAVIDDYNKLLGNVINDSTELYKKIIARQEPNYK